MDIILSKERIDDQECDILVIGMFKDERPLKGSRGWMDWRLNGKLSRFLIEKKLTGDWKETTLIASEGRLMARLILLIGLGEIKEYSYLRVREIFPHLIETLKKLNASTICLSLPFAENTDIDCGKLVEVSIESLTDCLDLLNDFSLAEWLKSIQLYFAEGEHHFYEILLGVQTAQSLLTERIPIRILTPKEPP